MWLGVVFFGLCVIIGCVALLVRPVLARDLGQWRNSDPVVREWFETLKQPDMPMASCCGEADAYWCDEIHVRDGRTYCSITDDRADEPLKRKHVPVGTEIFIPDYKLKWDRGNPTGHAIAFLAVAQFLDANGEHDIKRDNYSVYCFVQGGGT